jgi:hypothetical protein
MRVGLVRSLAQSAPRSGALAVSRAATAQPSTGSAERLGHRLSQLAPSAPAAPIQAYRNRKRWTPQQRAQSEKFWEKRDRRDQERARIARLPRVVQRSAHDPSQDGYTQTWTHPTTGDHRYSVSSGHGYRAEHRKDGPDITRLASRHEIETSIIEHLSDQMRQGLVPLHHEGEHQVSVAGQNVHYRFKRYANDRTGVGTYFLP